MHTKKKEFQVLDPLFGLGVSKSVVEDLVLHSLHTCLCVLSHVCAVIYLLFRRLGKFHRTYKKQTILVTQNIRMSKNGLLKDMTSLSKPMSKYLYCITHKESRFCICGHF